MFVQWTDHAFIGSPSDPPTHADRQWAGAVILPLAIAGDIITAPGQLIALLVTGDYGIYARPNREVIIYQQESRLEDGLRVAGLDADGNVTEIRLSEQQRSELAARLEDGSFDVATAERFASN